MTHRHFIAAILAATAFVVTSTVTLQADASTEPSAAKATVQVSDMVQMRF